MIAFRIDIVPPKATSQGAGKRLAMVKGKPMFFKNGKAESAENDLTLLCSQFAPPAPLEGPLALHVDFVWPWRKSEPKKRIALGRVPMTSKPDCSNAVKMLEDVLTKLGFWKDDNQITDLRVTKGWGDRPGITVRIEQVGMTPLPESEDSGASGAIGPRESEATHHIGTQRQLF